MKMVFQGKSPKQLATQLKDRTKNGNKSLEEMIEHIAHDDLVLAGWRPAERFKETTCESCRVCEKFYRMDSERCGDTGLKI